MVKNDQERLTSQLTPDQVVSMGTPLPDFTALRDVPSELGYRAHQRLEDILGMPIASDDANPYVGNDQTGQREGKRLGDVVGREKEFTKNLPVIEDNVKQVALAREVSESQIWDEITEVLTGAGIGRPMNRTLFRPVGESYGAREFIDENGSDGIAVILRENIANWGERRQQRLLTLLGSMSRRSVNALSAVIYGGGDRVYKGDELWRPDYQPYVFEEDGNKTSSITEARAAELFHMPRTRAILEKLGVGGRVRVDGVRVADVRASGDAVTEAIVQNFEDELKDKLIIEIGNAPAGYTQLAGGLVLARMLDLDHERQFLAITDGVEIVHPDHFASLDLEGKSKVQNAKTALNSFNGWLQSIARVNDFLITRDS